MSSHPIASPLLNVALLTKLREHAGQFVALDLLGDERARVVADLEALASFGFQVEWHPYRGVAYRGPAPRLCPDQVEHELGTERIGRRIAVWNRVGSTNDVAARAATTLANDGLVILAEEQTAGRGQRGRSWRVAPRSSVLLSVLLFPPPALIPEGQGAAAGCAWLTALGAVATAELVSEWTGAAARIKWPNDVRVEGRKLAGILVERILGPAMPASPDSSKPERRPGVVIGIGLNGNMDRDDFAPELRPSACSLSILQDGPVDRSEVARDLIRRLDRWYGLVLRQGVGPLSEAWRTRSEHLDRLVRVSTPEGPARGRLLSLDLQSGLTLEQEPGDVVTEGALDGAADGRRPERIEIGRVLSLEAE